jgi:hypothetical protein
MMLLLKVVSEQLKIIVVVGVVLDSSLVCNQVDKNQMI